jgi:oxygen-dependent protoporphyrinogen oxidase
MSGPSSHGHGTGESRSAAVAVVGGGIAGLSAAWELTGAAPGTRVIVLESDERLGGKLRTGAIGGRAVDLGPDAFLARRPEAVELCRELGLGDELVSPGSRRAFVWARGRLRPLPAALALGVPTRIGPLARSGILSPLGVGRVAVDLVGWPWRGRQATGGRSGGPGRPERPDRPDRPDRPVADITRQRLGREVTERLVDPLIGGIHAGDTSSMSAAAVFPALLDAASRPGSLMRALRPQPVTTGRDDEPVFYTVRGGLSRLVDSLESALVARGVEVRLRTPVEHLVLRGPGDQPSPGAPTTRWALRTPQGIVDADAVVIATPAGPAAGLLESVDPAIAALLGTIAYSDVTLVTLRLPTAGVERTLDGTGFLVPAGAGCLITACTWLTSKWPELQRPGDIVLRTSMGRFGDERANQMPDDEIVGRVVDELGVMLGLRAPPIEAVVTRWGEAFPQYAVGHVELVSAIERGTARLPALALAGAAFHGVGIPACIASGRVAARTVLGESVLTGHAPR